jgi:hypothetical protein
LNSIGSPDSGARLATILVDELRDDSSHDDTLMKGKSLGTGVLVLLISIHVHANR